MKRESKYKIIIAVLSVLLAAAIGVLVFVLVRNGRAVSDTSASSGNLISPASAASEIGNVPRSLNRPVRRILSASPGADEKIKLTEAGKEKALPFAVSGMLPGDSVSKTFTVTAADKSAETLSFSANVVSGSVPGDKMTLTVKAGQTVLYSGKLASLQDKKYSINAPCDVDYTITVALDRTAGNEYAGLSVVMTFVWSFEYEEYDPVSVTYTDGADGSAFGDQTYVVKRGDETPGFVGKPEREGYVFTGWYPETAPTVTDNVTYTAQWAVEVVFVSGGKTTSKLVDEGYAVEKPPVPEKAGSGFAGWYLDPAFTVKYDFNSPLSAGVTLYARFFLFGDIDGDGRVTAADADLIGLYVMEVESANIKNILAGHLSSLDGYVTVNDANEILLYVMEVIDGFPVENISHGCEFDIENGRIIRPGE